jgi:uncharacterized membrane protein
MGHLEKLFVFNVLIIAMLLVIFLLVRDDKSRKAIFLESVLDSAQ